MNAKDKLRSFAESREHDMFNLPQGALSYRDARELMAALDCLITPAEKEILDAAKALACKPVRRIENGFDPDGPESIPAPTGMMLLGGRGEIRKVCEAVIRWRATQDSGPGADRHEADPPLGAGPGLTGTCEECGRHGPLRIVGIRLDFAALGQPSSHGGERRVCANGCGDNDRYEWERHHG